MDFLQRQYKLFKFTQILKRIFNNPSLTTYKLQKNALYNKVKDYFFSKTNPLSDKENGHIFPRATKQFEEAIKNGHGIDSMHELDFLKSEFNDYFNELAQEQVLLSDNDRPPSYFLNHKSPKVYWLIGIMVASSFIWSVIKLFKD